MKALKKKKTYLRFVEQEQPSSRKTKIWKIFSSVGETYLGYIKWWPGWRRYCFFAEYMMLFDVKCLNELSLFMQAEMDIRAANKRRRK